MLCPVPAFAGVAGSVQLPIANGEDDAEYDDVVQVNMETGSLCTGTLVAPTLVLTAAHCFRSAGSEQDAATVSFGPDAEAPWATIDAAGTYVPEEWVGGAFLELDTPEDYAVVELAEPAEVPPMRLLGLPLDDDALGRSFLAVGYGRDEDNELPPVRQRAELEIATYSDTHLIGFLTGLDDAQPCPGDSGGPAIVVGDDGVARHDGVFVSMNCFNTTAQPGSFSYTRGDVAQEFLGDVAADRLGEGDLCAINERYGDGVCDPSCAEEDEDCVVDDGQGCQASLSGEGDRLGWAAVLLLAAVRARRGPRRSTR